MKKRRSGLTIEQVEEIKLRCDSLIEELSGDFSVSRYQVAKEIHYRIQRSKTYRINPSKKEKEQSLKHWKNKCYECGKLVGKGDCEFHHIQRDVDSPHGKENMAPIHKSCHQKHHS